MTDIIDFRAVHLTRLRAQVRDQSDTMRALLVAVILSMSDDQIDQVCDLIRAADMFPVKPSAGA